MTHPSPVRTALTLTLAIATVAALSVAVAAWQGPSAAAATPEGRDSVGLVDTAQGVWHLRDVAGDVKFFFFGNPGDTPFMGDWDCDGIDTPGLFRRSTGLVYLRNANSQGLADRRFFFGNPGDVPVAGDFDGDGCDSVSIYRPGEGKFYVINRLGADGRGLGAADADFFFGNLGDAPIAGDWDGDGDDTVGLFRASTALVYLRNALTPGPADVSFIFGDPGDRHVAGDWDGDGIDSTAVFRPATMRYFLKNSNGFGPADAEFFFGQPTWLPVAGDFGDLEPTPPTTTTLAPGTPFAFEDGLKVVGIDVPAGTYRNVDSTSGCFWERLTPAGVVIASNLTINRQIVTIEPTDGFFNSERCVLWDNDLTPRRFDRFADFRGGHYLVPDEVGRGIWQSAVPFETCTWQLLSDFTGEASGVIASNTTSSRATVSISTATFPNLVGFNSVGCGFWTLVG